MNLALWFRMDRGSYSPDEWAGMNANRWMTYARIRNAYYDGAQEAADAVTANKDLSEMTKGAA